MPIRVLVNQWNRICPGCSASVPRTHVRNHLFNCPSPSTDLNKVRAFAGSVCECVRCGRLLVREDHRRHESVCKLMPLPPADSPVTRSVAKPKRPAVQKQRGARVSLQVCPTGQDRAPLSTGSRAGRIAQSVPSDEKRIPGVCPLCGLSIGTRSLNAHFANDCAKRRSNVSDRVTSRRPSADCETSGWWHGGE
jgi:hypothetical protein